MEVPEEDMEVQEETVLRKADMGLTILLYGLGCFFLPP